MGEGEGCRGGEAAALSGSGQGPEAPGKGGKRSRVPARWRRPLGFAGTAVLGWVWFYPCIAIMVLLLGLLFEPQHTGEAESEALSLWLLAVGMVFAPVAVPVLRWAGAERPVRTLGIAMLASSLVLLVIVLPVAAPLIDWESAAPFVVFSSASSLVFLATAALAANRKEPPT
ncbi:hypothetical protein J0910_01070 [Nocardiopsis sp. CNT-189]|uniref:hypothetical protein n=1 Tax=Nocardiopsis oceanisediminis TaxID=2816862 RepID=UPI003B32B3D3